jgi:hypothetical protein
MFIFWVILLHNLITSYYIQLLFNCLFIRCLKENISPCCVGYFSGESVVLDVGYFFVKKYFFQVFNGFKSKNTAQMAVFLMYIFTFF